jgi:hypothetical protein
MGVNIKKQSYKKEGAKNNLPMLAVRVRNLKRVCNTRTKPETPKDTGW